MTIDRRSFLKSVGLGISVMSLTGVSLLLTPAEAKAKQLPFKMLSPEEASLLEAFADELVPGASKAGVAYFIDEQLIKPVADSLLMVRYLQVEPPYVNFYKGALAAFNGYCQNSYQKPFTELTKEQKKKAIGSLYKMGPRGPEKPPGWQGPPAFLVYLSLRADAVDVVYGTQEGFKKLDIPYLAHIEPEQKW